MGAWVGNDVPSLRLISLTRGGGIGPTVCVSIAARFQSLPTLFSQQFAGCDRAQHCIIRSYVGLTLHALASAISRLLYCTCLYCMLLYDDVMSSPTHAAHVHSLVQCALEVNLV